MLLHLFLTLTLVVAEQVQYCRFGHQHGDADFCMGLTSSFNTVTLHHDLHIALSIRRSSALGWTAIGTGPSMAGALMIVVYGDPSSGTDPVVSIRTTDGHHEPQPLTSASTGGAHITATSAEWQPLSAALHQNLLPARHEESAPPPAPTGPPTHTALISLTCHSCALFPGSSISLSDSHSQPMIWAWNDRQAFDSSYPEDARLEMHHHGRGSGGFGKFYVDMARAVLANGSSTPPLAGELPLKGEDGSLLLAGASESPIGVAGWFAALWENPLARVHGFVMGMAFVVMFPLGVVLIRLGGEPGVPFRRHWVVQAVATGLAWVGAVIGAVLSGGRWPRTVHQWLGVGIVLGLAVQGVLGWRHHVRFVRIRSRSWVSYAHIWLGRVVVVGGWVNAVLGMLLAGWSRVGVMLIGVLTVAEAVGLGLFLWKAQREPAKKQAVPDEVEGEGHALMPTGTTADDYFVLEMSDGDSEDTGDDQPLQKRQNKGRHGRKQNVEVSVAEG
jgi:hypothetical protein